MLIGPTWRVVEEGARLAGRTVVEASLAATSVPFVDTVPVRRVGFGLAMFLDPKGSNLLDFLGDDLDERARTIDHFLSQCSEEEVNELLAAFQAAVLRRALRASDGRCGPRRDSTQRSFPTRQTSSSSRQIVDLRRTLDELSTIVDRLTKAQQEVDSSD
jgi:hypothetical protein